MSDPIELAELLNRLGQLSQSGLNSMSASMAFWNTTRQLAFFSITVKKEEFWAHHPGTTDTPVLLKQLADLYAERENYRDLHSVFNNLLVKMEARGINIHPYRFWQPVSVKE